MRGDMRPVLYAGKQMGVFMKIGNQKSVGIEITINGDAMLFF
jgi:hypothetical protein